MINKTLKVEFLDEKGKLTSKLLSEILADSDTWEMNGLQIIKFNGCKKLADKARIAIKEDDLIISPTADNKQQHGYRIVVGFKGDMESDNWTTAIGEASTLNTGKIVTGADGKLVYSERKEIDAKYRLAMAFKRAYCTAILDHLNLRDKGFYSDVESTDFTQQSADIVKGAKLNYSEL